MCHFIVYNFHDTIFHRTVSKKFWFACDAMMLFLSIKLVITNPNHVKVREIKFCQFTMNQTNHTIWTTITYNSCLLLDCIWYDIHAMCFTVTRKPIYKKSCIPSLSCVLTPLLSGFEVKKTTQFDWFWGLNLKTNCTFPFHQPAVEKLSVGSACNIYYLLLLLFVAKPYGNCNV